MNLKVHLEMNLEMRIWNLEMNWQNEFSQVNLTQQIQSAYKPTESVGGALQERTVQQFLANYNHIKDCHSRPNGKLRITVPVVQPSHRAVHTMPNKPTQAKAKSPST